jgi:hypothetical protein
MKQDSATSDVPPSIRRALKQNEEIVWHGMPAQGVLLRAADWYLIPMSMLFMAIISYVTVLALASPTPDGDLMATIVRALMVLMTVLGLYLCGGRFVVDAWRRRHTSYAITATRVIITRQWPGRSSLSFDLATLTNVVLDEGFGDVGTIRFNGTDDAIFYLMGGDESWPWSAWAASPRLERIRKAREVYQILTIARDKLDSEKGEF